MIECGREIVEHADDVVLHGAEPLGALAAVPVLHQQRLGAGTALRERRLQPLRQRGAQLALASLIGIAQAREIGRDGIGVDERGSARQLVGGRQHFEKSG